MGQEGIYVVKRMELNGTEVFDLSPPFFPQQLAHIARWLSCCRMGILNENTDAEHRSQHRPTQVRLNESRYIHVK